MASPSDCRADYLQRRRRRGWRRQRRRDHGGARRGLFSSIRPLASARSFRVGITSTPVTSKRRVALEFDRRGS
jgi:hypothetical protein